MKTEKPKLDAKDHRCNAVRFLAKRYLETVYWIDVLKAYKFNHMFDSKCHTALESFYNGLAMQLYGMMVEMAGCDFVLYIEAHAVNSDDPGRHIEEALVRAKLKKRDDK